MIARCVRCHGAGGHLNGDPLYERGTPPTDSYFAQYDDSGDCVGAAAMTDACMRGAKYYAGQIKVFIHLEGPGRMPPPPSDPLSDRQLEVLDRWLAEPTPKP